MTKIEDIAPRRSGKYVDAEERALLIGCPLNLVAVDEEPNAQYGPRWLIEAAVVATGEIVLIPLGATTKAIVDGKSQEVDNAGRRAVLSKVAAALAAGDGVDPVILFRDGTGPSAPWVFRSATDDEIAEPAAPDFPVEADAPETPTVIAGERLSKAGRR
jgi:hypothetical protein